MSIPRMWQMFREAVAGLDNREQFALLMLFLFLAFLIGQLT